MAFQKKLASLSITPEEADYLEQLASSRAEGIDRVRRARINAEPVIPHWRYQPESNS